MAPYAVCAVVAVTVMHMLLFVSMLRECEGDGNADVETGKVWLR